MVNEDFAKWAVGYSGFVGGNQGGSTCLCGIEDAGGHRDETLVFNDVSSPAFLGDHNSPGGISEFLAESRFNQNAIKLLMAVKGRSDFENGKDFLAKERCFGSDSNYFKLNLYPIAFQNDSHQLWMDWHTRRTGLADKDAYWKWCAEHRFPVMRQWVRDFAPSLIICVGVSYLDSFLQAFTDGETRHSCTAGDKTINYAYTNGGKTLVAVTYFLGGRHGLNSKARILETGTKLAKLTGER